MKNLKNTGYTKRHTFKVSKAINAPLHYVFKWCTDFRESDPKISGTKSKRTILLKTEHRVIYTSSYRSNGKPASAVNVVTLIPPKAWHLDFIGDEDDEIGEYRLTKLGPRRTRLDMKFTEGYKIAKAPTASEDTKHTHEVWDKYIAALERDYRKTKC